VFKKLFSGEDIEFDDLCETKQVMQGVMYLEGENGDRVHVGKIGRFVPVNDGGAKLLRVKDDKAYAVSGTKDHLWMEASVYQSLKKQPAIDMSYFERLAGGAVQPGR
jgi:hypothetical protein